MQTNIISTQATKQVKTNSKRHPRRPGPSERKLTNITVSLLRPYFKKPISFAANELGVSESTLKKRCRSIGVARWPHRKVFLKDNN